MKTDSDIYELYTLLLPQELKVKSLYNGDTSNIPYPPPASQSYGTD